MKRILFPFFALFISIGYAQQFSGVVQDAHEKTPLEGVHVSIVGKSVGVSTDKDGSFAFSNDLVLQPNDSVILTFVGYTTKRTTVGALGKNKICLLYPRIEYIDDVTVSARKHLREQLRFTRLKSMKEGLNGFASVVAQGKIYVFGGDISFIYSGQLRDMTQDISLSDFQLTGNATAARQLISQFNKTSFSGYTDKIQVYDIATDSWELKGNLPKPMAYHSIWLNPKDGNIWLMGGKSISLNRKHEYLNDKILVYNTKTGKAQIDNVNPHQVVEGLTVPVKDGFISLGGSVKQNDKGVQKYSPDMYAYAQDTGEWFKVGQMTTGKEPRGAIVDNTLYLFGGWRNGALDTIESYDLKNGVWQKEGNLFGSMAQVSVTTDGQKIYLYDRGRFIVFDPKVKSLSQYSTAISVHNPTLHFNNGKIYLMGGFANDYVTGDSSAKVFQIDVKDFDFTKIEQRKFLGKALTKNSK